MNDNAKSFLGAGFKYPIQVDEATGRIKMSLYEEDIAEAIRIIIMTRKGERVMRPEFGCDIHLYAFAAVNYTTIVQMEISIKNSLVMWEPRIRDIEVNIDTSQEEEGRLLINISYVERSTNNLYNLVYPYYLNEGIST